MVAIAKLELLRARLASQGGVRLGVDLHVPPHRPCDWPELDAFLPDGGLPHGVVEIVSHGAPGSFAGATAIAAAAVRAAHARGAGAHCAWIDATRTLYAPGLVRAGIDLSRLLVVRPPPGELARVLVKVTASGAFDIVVVDVEAARRRAERGGALVRKLALSAEPSGTTVLLLTEAHARAGEPWPVALRLEVARTTASLVLRITKERHGRLGHAKTEIPAPHAHGPKGA